MPEINDVPIYSSKDILTAYKNYDGSDEAKEPVLYFLSELTGMSVDTIMIALDAM